VDSLAGLGPQYRDEAVAALRRVLANRRTYEWNRRAAADALARLGPQ
jgi:hypothetical protein